VIKPLTARGNIELVEHDDSQYVLKTIDDSLGHDEIREWENELKTLLLLRDSPNIIDIEALVDIANPYFPDESRVVSGFLIEYASRGALSQILEDNREREFHVKIKWALNIAEGLRDMHVKGLIHGDIKPHNIVITSRNVAKLIDFGGKEFSKGYSAPEMLSIIVGNVPWPKTLDIYSFGILLRELLLGIPNESLIGISEYSPLNALISACVSENPNDRPQISEGITSIKKMIR